MFPPCLHCSSLRVLIPILPGHARSVTFSILPPEEKQQRLLLCLMSCIFFCKMESPINTLSVLNAPSFTASEWLFHFASPWLLTFPHLLSLLFLSFLSFSSCYSLPFVQVNSNFLSSLLHSSCRIYSLSTTVPLSPLFLYCHILPCHLTACHVFCCSFSICFPCNHPPSSQSQLKISCPNGTQRVTQIRRLEQL